MTPKYQVDFPDTFHIPDWEHPTRLDWRECKFKIVVFSITEAHLRVSANHRADQRGCEIFRSPLFIEMLAHCIDPAMRRTIGPAFRALEGEQASYFRKGDITPLPLATPHLLVADIPFEATPSLHLEDLSADEWVEIFDIIEASAALTARKRARDR